MGNVTTIKQLIIIALHNKTQLLINCLVTKRNDTNASTNLAFCIGNPNCMH